ncbi:hypothetical protein JXB02_05330 [Candidatus Woesearchaeota archaeon]|nr:hypothetical protein [Candidatus Woesearchaeota archaeon]
MRALEPAMRAVIGAEIRREQLDDLRNRNLPLEDLEDFRSGGDELGYRRIERAIDSFCVKAVSITHQSEGEAYDTINILLISSLNSEEYFQ